MTEMTMDVNRAPPSEMTRLSSNLAHHQVKGNHLIVELHRASILMQKYWRSSRKKWRDERSQVALSYLFGDGFKLYSNLSKFPSFFFCLYLGLSLERYEDFLGTRLRQSKRDCSSKVFCPLRELIVLMHHTYVNCYCHN